MLTDCKDESVVHSQTLALWLCDVQVVALSVGCWVSSQKLIRGILASVDNGKRKSERMWNILDRMHKSPLSSINFQYSIPFVPR